MLRALLFGILGWAIPAWGADSTTLLLPLSPMDRVVLDDTIQKLDQAGWDALSTEEWSLRLEGREDILLEQIYLSPGRRLLEEGRLLYEQALSKEAIAVLEQAVGELEKVAGTVDTTRDLWDAWMYLGTSKASEGDEAGAQAAWRNALTIQPERIPDARRFPPNIIASWRGLQEKLERGQLSISSDVPVLFQIDGVKKGKTPQVISDLPLGEHRILGQAENGDRAFARVVVRSQDGHELTLSPMPPILGAEDDSSGRSRQVSALVRALADRVDADTIVLLYFENILPMFQVYFRRSDAFTAPIALETVSSGVIAEKIAFASTTPDELLTTAASIDLSAAEWLGRRLLAPASLKPVEQPAVIEVPAVVVPDIVTPTVVTPIETTKIEPIVEAVPLPNDQHLLEPIKIKKPRKRWWIPVLTIGVSAAAATGAVFAVHEGAKDKGQISVGPFP